MGRKTNADPAAGADAPDRSRRRGQPQVGMKQRVGAVEGAIDCERPAEPARPAAEFA